ncbi:MAG: TerB family tellurite resistance protein [Labilithrix sp.]|nr:TerB family tellurite resistance protein [Labilithrix sp.]
MVTPALSSTDRHQVLRFAASFLWADLELADSERCFLTELAHELDLHDAPEAIANLLASPPTPEDVDPTSVPPAVADLVRHAALRAIAADGRVAHDEMTMFELLDDLLPRPSPTA